MMLLVLESLAGLLTIASPCTWPILPFVPGAATKPVRHGGLSMLVTWRSASR
jgi:cytochrome c biogenesis protein CcdA